MSISTAFDSKVVIFQNILAEEIVERLKSLSKETLLLDMSGCHLDNPSHLMAIFQAIPPQIKFLKLERCLLNSQHAQALEFLVSERNLSYLSVKDNAIGDVGALALSKSTTLMHLDLSFCMLGEEGKNALRANQAIVKLQSGYEIEDKLLAQRNYEAALSALKKQIEMHSLNELSVKVQALIHQVEKLKQHNKEDIWSLTDILVATHALLIGLETADSYKTVMKGHIQTVQGASSSAKKILSGLMLSIALAIVVSGLVMPIGLSIGGIVAVSAVSSALSVGFFASSLSSGLSKSIDAVAKLQYTSEENLLDPDCLYQ